MKQSNILFAKIPQTFKDKFNFEISEYKPAPFNGKKYKATYSLRWQSINGYQTYNMPLCNKTHIEMGEHCLLIVVKDTRFRNSLSIFLNGTILQHQY